MRVNLDGMFNTCRNVIEGMTARGFGRIVNLSSVNGQTGQFGQTNYSAAKAGVHGFGMALARETARKGVTVNTVSPGYCDTPMVAAVRAGRSRADRGRHPGRPARFAGRHRPRRGIPRRRRCRLHHRRQPAGQRWLLHELLSRPVAACVGRPIAQQWPITRDGNDVSQPPITLVGGGLVGALLAHLLARQRFCRGRVREARRSAQAGLRGRAVDQPGPGRARPAGPALRRIWPMTCWRTP